MVDDYRFWAVLSALFAGLTAVLAKKGVEGVPSNLALFVRVCVVVVLAGGVAFATKQLGVGSLSKPAWTFLVLSGFATGASWLCYFRALKIGEVSKVAPIDKLSFVIAMVLGMAFLKEAPNWKTLVGAGIIVGGVLLTLA